MSRDLILKLIRMHQPISRVELSRASALQIRTISSIIAELLAEGWICERKLLTTSRGRRPTQISLNPARAVLVADVHAGQSVVAVMDLNGGVLESEQVALPAEGVAALHTLAEAMLKIRARHAACTFAGAAVCLSGRVDRATGQLHLAPALNLDGCDVHGVLTAKLKMPVELENQANVCLLAELWFGQLQGVRNAVLITIAKKIGAALLMGGCLVNGRLGLAGEIGHLCSNPAGPQCGCGRRGCWQVYASSCAALRYYRDLVPGAKLKDYAALVARADQQDRHALTALRRQGEEIGRGLRAVTAALDPEVVLFTGEIRLGWQTLLPALQQACGAGMLAGSPPRLACTEDAATARLKGAVAVIFERHANSSSARSQQKKTQPPASRIQRAAG